jgi:hypothetical protein
VDTISQDWNLLYSAELNGYTIFKFSRLINLCNDQDKTIGQGTPHVIYAWSDKDPAPGEDIYFFNAENQGTESVNLLNDGKKDGYQVAESEEKVHFLIENVSKKFFTSTKVLFLQLYSPGTFNI